MKPWLLWPLLAAGGSVGAILRYAVAGWIQTRGSGMFPWGTLAVNVVGCLAMGLLAQSLVRGGLVSAEVRIALLVGVLGAFTTFSTFSYEALRLGADGQWGLLAGNVLGTNAACLLAVWIGDRLASVLLG